MMLFRSVPRKLLVFVFLEAALFSVVWVVYPPYLRMLGFTASEYGLLGSLIGASSLLLTIVSGWLLDRARACSMISLSLLLGSIEFVFLSTGNKVLVYASALLGGACNTLYFLSLDVLVSRIVSSQCYSRAYSYIYAFSQLGGAVGCYAGWIPQIVGEKTGSTLLVYRWSILVIAFLLPTLLPILKGISEDKPLGGKRIDIREFKSMLRGGIGVVVLAELVIGFGAAMSVHNMSYYFVLKYNVESGSLGTVYGFENLVMAGLMMLMPRISDFAGSPLKAYVSVSMTSVPLLVLITLVNNYAAAATLFIARTALMNAAYPLLTTVVMLMTKESARGKVLGMISFVREAVTIPGRYLGGCLMQRNLEAPLRITAVLYTAALIYLLVGLGSRNKKAGSAG